MPRGVALILAGSALALGACASTPRAVKVQSPFCVPRERFYPSLKVLAVMPVSPATRIPEPARQQIAAMVEGQLQDAGLQVVPAAEVGPSVLEVTKANGGFYDPLTGREDPGKAAIIRTEVFRTLKEKHGADALLYPGVVVRDASMEEHRVRWDGVQEDGKVQTSDGYWTRFWKEFFRGRGTGQGTVPALSLRVTLVGVDGQCLYEKLGGLQILGRYDADGTWIPVPRSEILADPDTTSRAGHLALDELLGR